MYWTKPEQSKPLGVSPPHTYGTPTYLSPRGTTRRVAPAALLPTGHTVPEELPPRDGSRVSTAPDRLPPSRKSRPTRNSVALVMPLVVRMFIASGVLERISPWMEIASPSGKLRPPP